jgi:hypothetical protein
MHLIRKIGSWLLALLKRYTAGFAGVSTETQGDQIFPLHEGEAFSRYKKDQL